MLAKRVVFYYVPYVMDLDHSRALLLFSGGQDSAICLAWALTKFEHVETIGFEYGQRHHVGLQARQNIRSCLTQQSPEWAKRLGQDHLLDLSILSELGSTGMTDEVEIKMTDTGLPNTFVPGRNLAFLVSAAALAYRRNIGVLVGGMCETDYSGYPDCRAEALEAQLKALQLGMETDFALETPLMSLTKAQSWQLADELGGDSLVKLINEHSHTCYIGKRDVRHEWGYGCSTCPACELRAKGWQDYKAGI